MDMFKLQPIARSPVTRGTVVEESSERSVEERWSARNYGQEISEILVTNLSDIREMCNYWNNESRNSNLHRTRGYGLLIRAINWCVNAFQWLNKIIESKPCTPKCIWTIRSPRTSYCDPTITLFLSELPGHPRESNILLRSFPCNSHLPSRLQKHTALTDLPWDPRAHSPEFSLAQY